MRKHVKRWRSGILAVAVVALSSGAQAACKAPGGAADMRQQVISWINSERAANGLSALRMSSTLQKSATSHACDMAARDYFAHEGPGGPSFLQRLQKAGYRIRAANENIAKTSSTSVEQVASLWRNSPGHLANVLDPKVREVGVGLAEAGGKVYWVTNSGKS